MLGLVFELTIPPSDTPFLIRINFSSVYTKHRIIHALKVHVFARTKTLSCEIVFLLIHWRITLYENIATPLEMDVKAILKQFFFSLCHICECDENVFLFFNIAVHKRCIT